MTAKEKAKELVEKYSFVEIANYTSIFEVKQCCFILVEEMLGQYYLVEHSAEIRYWEQVKQELEKM